jgi:hypothetical protein
VGESRHWRHPHFFKRLKDEDLLLAFDRAAEEGNEFWLKALRLEWERRYPGGR